MLVEDFLEQRIDGQCYYYVINIIAFLLADMRFAAGSRCGM